MRIDLNSGKIEQLHETTARRPAESARGKTLDTQNKADVSSCGCSYSQLTASVMDLPEIRAERVSELRNAITEGVYKVDSRAVAESILNDLF